MSINVIKYNSPPSALWKYQGGIIIFNCLIIWGLTNLDGFIPLQNFNCISFTLVWCNPFSLYLVTRKGMDGLEVVMLWRWVGGSRKLLGSWFG